MDRQQALDFALEHLHNKAVYQFPLSHYKLNEQLQQALISAYQRVRDSLREVKRQDVVLLVECWIISKNVNNPDELLILR